MIFVSGTKKNVNTIFPIKRIEIDRKILTNPYI